MASTPEIPIIDVGALVAGAAGRHAVAAELGAACRDSGFFYVVGHGVDAALQARLYDVARAFFAQDLAEKRRIGLAAGGRAWRGYFAVGEELTSGVPDQKEGIYFGAELGADDPRVVAGTPLHGPNLFGDTPGLRATVLDYMRAMTTLGHALTAGLSLALGLDERYLADRYTADPLTLFRIFNYPAQGQGWGVAEHTDYGLLTILLQDDAGGLEVRSRSGWIFAPPVPGSFVCNLGDMLDRMTRGRFRSTPHRVRNTSARDRLSFPFFFDPSYAARVEPLPLVGDDAPPDDPEKRWDGRSVHAFDGTYGEYLVDKVSRVFPALRQVL